MKENKFLNLVLIVVSIVLGVAIVGDVLIGIIANKVVQRIKQDYSPYGPNSKLQRPDVNLIQNAPKAILYDYEVEWKNLD
jgi:hypothetical protein